MYVLGVEAIKQYIPPDKTEFGINIKEEREQTVNTAETMSSIERYRQEWETLIQCLEQPDFIRNQAFNGQLKMSKFRSLYWALLLRVLNTDISSWHEQRQRQRIRYEKLKQEFLKDPRNLETPDDNPLSQSKQSVWNQYFSDQELFAVIRQDVIRTFPGVEFFRKTVIQKSMCNILFYYAREHPYMCYRQGMHEILAPILFTIYSDHQSLLHFAEIAKMTTDKVLFDVLNPTYFDADSYSMFTRLMSLIEPYYRITNFIQSESGYLNPRDERSEPAGAEVISQLNFIREKILAKEDLQLHNYLLKLEIPLHIFGIRWLRLLFGREFSLLDLLVVWDTIFADSDRFDLPNYILVSMLICIREKLLRSDQTLCLTHLMCYPTNMDVNVILRYALHMLMPKKFDKPPNVSIRLNENEQPIENQPKYMYKRSSLDFRKEYTDDMNKFLSAPPTKLMPSINEEVNLRQVRNAADFAETELRFRTDGLNTDFSIMDGYSKNSPELILLELKNAQTLISIAHSKLQSYLAIIRKHISKQTAHELHVALDGMEELCSFLDMKFMFPLYAHRTPIDEALEANEQWRVKANLLKDSNTIFYSGRLSSGSSAEAQIMKDQDVDLKLMNSDYASKPLKSSYYEMPEDSNISNSIRLLGNLREIELVTIEPSEGILEDLHKKSEINTNQRSADAPLMGTLVCHRKQEK